MKRDLTDVIGYIYKLTSPNGKIYIGQTINKKQRKHHYKFGDFKQQVKLWRSCIAHGWNPVDTFEIIEECYCGSNKENINSREKHWIQYYNSFKKGLNCNEGGNGNLGRKPSKETLRKMSVAKIGVKHNEERNKQKSKYTLGRTHTQASKDKMSVTKRKNMTNKVKDKIRIGLLGNKNGVGNKGAARKVLCLNNGRIYDSIKKAADILSLQETGIVSVCKNKRKQTKGYIFQYYE